MGARIPARPMVCPYSHTDLPDGHADLRQGKQCYHCQGLGHVQADCPTLRISGAGTGGGRCYSCGQPGHLAVPTSASRMRSFLLTVTDSDLVQMQVFNPELHSVQVGELFHLAEDSPAVFAEALREGLVVHALQHATNVVDRTITPVTVRPRQ